MPSTTVHIPDELLFKIDQVVKEKEISRNRFIIQACERELKENSGKWPEDFFEPAINDEDLRLLREGVSEMENSIIVRRHNRSAFSL